MTRSILNRLAGLPAWVYFALFLGVVSALTLLSLPLPLNVNFRDELMYLTGAHRVRLGQVPHLDFHTPVPPLTFLLVALGYVMTGPSMDAILLAKLVGFIVISSAAWFLGQQRLSKWDRILFTAFLGLAPFLPRYLDFTDISQSFFYNRIGYPILALILFECLSSRVETATAKRCQFIDGFITGTFLIALFLLKQNLFVLGAGGVVLGAFLLRRDNRRYAGLISGLLLAGLLALFYLRFQVGMVLRDWAYALQLLNTRNRQNLSVFYWIKSLIRDLGVYAVVYLLLFIVLLPVKHGYRLARIRGLSPTLVFLFLAGVHTVVRRTTSDAPVHLFIVLVAFMLGMFDLSAKKRTLIRLASCLVIVPLMLMASISLAYPILVKTRGQSQIVDLPMKLSIQAGARDAERLARLYQEGVGLLRSRVDQGSKILALAFTEPFSMMLGTDPPRNALLYWDWLQSYTGQVHPDAQELFSDVNLVMALKPDGDLRDVMSGAADSVRIYQEELNQNWKILGQSGNWLLYERR